MGLPGSTRGSRVGFRRLAETNFCKIDIRLLPEQS